MRILVDTNIFLDLALKRDNGCKDALEFFIWCRKYRNQTYVTSMSIRDIEYVAVKYLHDRKKANIVISNVYSLVSKVIGISADCAINAIYEDYKDYEDELIVQAAKENMLDAIVTNNIRDFENRGVPVFTPKEIMQKTAFVVM